MPWFRIDDGFWCHPKVLRCTHRAIALWVRAGSWCAQQLTDGYVPASALPMLNATRTDAGQLVKAGLWAVDGDGWRFHQWDERQPTREAVEADRAAVADRVRRYRKRKRQDPDEPPADDSQEGSSNGTGNALRHAAVTVPPARPGPARPVPLLLTYVGRLAVGDARDAYDGPPAEQIDAWHDLAGPLVDLQREAAAYLARYADRPARDPAAAWRGWLTTARKRAEQQRRPPIGCPRCHDGWLDDDEQGRPRPCPTCRPRHLRPVDDPQPRGQTA